MSAPSDASQSRSNESESILQRKPRRNWELPPLKIPPSLTSHVENITDNQYRVSQSPVTASPALLPELNTYRPSPSSTGQGQPTQHESPSHISLSPLSFTAPQLLGSPLTEPLGSIPSARSLSLPTTPQLPNPPKTGSHRRNWKHPLVIPVIPSPPADASKYTLASMGTPLSSSPALNTSLLFSPAAETPALIGSPLPAAACPHCGQTPTTTVPSPTASPLSARLSLLHLQARETPHPESPAPRLSKWEHVDAVLGVISKHFDAFGDFMEAFSEDPEHGEKDPRSQHHKSVLSRWLSGQNRFRPVDFVQAVYRNRYSVPKYKSEHYNEIEHVFDPTYNLSDISFARIALSIWATVLVGKRCSLEVGELGQNDPDFPDFMVFLQASANSRTQQKRKLVSPEDVNNFSMGCTMDVLKARAPTSWYLTECMAGPLKNGQVYVRERRPHPFIQAVALSAFALSRNPRANGYMALVLALYLFASKTHTRVKRLLSRIALCAHDTTARDALTNMGQQRRITLQAATAESLKKKEPSVRKVLDNVQKYQLVHEPGIGKTSQMITGTAATAIVLDDYVPGSFAFGPYQERIIQNERATLTLPQLLDDVPFDHYHLVSCLHVVFALCDSFALLQKLTTLISERFRSEPVAKHRMREGRKTVVVPLGANSHNEMEVHGMRAAQEDFDAQVGYTAETITEARILLWDGGDGGSVLSGARVMRHLLSQNLNIYDSYECRIWTPGLFHKQMNMVNVIAENHYGSKTTKDPSALSRAAAATNLYIPTKLSSCDFYRTSRTMNTIWRAQVLDLWDLVLTNHTGLLPHLEGLAARNALPTLDELMAHANTIVNRYFSPESYHTVLDSSLMNDLDSQNKYPEGPVWCTTNPAAPEAVDGEIHVEHDGFTGDRCLANSIIFRRDFVLWKELSDAISDGDVGRVVEVLKIWTFIFAGGGKQNYANILLELYCFFRYEATADLKNAIWNNWLVNLTGELGKWLPDDHLQEHHNRWLQDMLPKHVDSFDDSFFRDTISPNVRFFLDLKDEMESMFQLSDTGRAHTSPGTKDETRVLMNMYREEKLHYFCKGRTMGHAAAELVDKGYAILDGGKFASFQADSTEDACLVAALKNDKATTPETPQHGDENESNENDGSKDEQNNEYEGWIFRYEPEEEDMSVDGDESGGDRDVDTMGWSVENIMDEQVLENK